MDVAQVRFLHCLPGSDCSAPGYFLFREQIYGDAILLLRCSLGFCKLLIINGYFGLGYGFLLGLPLPVAVLNWCEFLYSDLKDW